MRNIDIFDATSFRYVCDVLHDASCDVDAASYDTVAGTWRATFRRFTDDPNAVRVAKRGLIFNQLAIPLVESTLLLHGVASFHIEDRAGIGTYSFSTCALSDNKWLLRFNENLNIRLSFITAPSGSLTDVRSLNEEDTSVHVLRWGSGRLGREQPSRS